MKCNFFCIYLSTNGKNNKKYYDGQLGFTYIQKTYNGAVYYTIVKIIIIRNKYKYVVINETDTYYTCECLDKKHDSFIRHFAKYKEKYSTMPNGASYSNKRSETITPEEVKFN